MRKFFEVAPEHKKVDAVTQMPVRGTKKSAGYDFFSKIDAVVAPGKVVKIWTDVKAAMEDDDVLFVDIRSSMGGKWYLLSILGVIDADYFGNERNDGNIGFFLKNISDEVQEIHIGDRIGQGVFTKYLVTDDDCVQTERKGGFGSTN